MNKYSSSILTLLFVLSGSSGMQAAELGALMFGSIWAGCVPCVCCTTGAAAGLYLCRDKKSLDMPLAKSMHTFNDVIGGVPQEIEDIKRFIEDPQSFKDAGASMPRGYLLYGPPGTGKTLLARALAGEVEAAFFAMSGASTNGLYRGDGVKKIRKAFTSAREAIQMDGYQKAIIFIDELDSIGKRTPHDNPVARDDNSTINELLTQMDGFNKDDVDGNIIVMGATNHPDLIDEALKRSGRFEKHIEIKIPDIKAREALLKYYASLRFNRNIDINIDLHDIARQTEGLNCADIAHVINQAAIETARKKQTIISSESIQIALEQVRKIGHAFAGGSDAVSIYS